CQVLTDSSQRVRLPGDGGVCGLGGLVMVAKGERVILIGGGATSALAAIRLAERGFAVTVLEKAALGNGSSSRSNAGIRAQFGVQAPPIGMMYPEDWYARFPDLLETPLRAPPPAIRPN